MGFTEAVCLLLPTWAICSTPQCTNWTLLENQSSSPQCELKPSRVALSGYAWAGVSCRIRGPPEVLSNLNCFVILKKEVNPERQMALLPASSQSYHTLKGGSNVISQEFSSQSEEKYFVVYCKFRIFLAGNNLPSVSHPCLLGVNSLFHFSILCLPPTCTATSLLAHILNVSYTEYQIDFWTKIIFGFTVSNPGHSVIITVNRVSMQIRFTYL